jgi:hypothetical protein
MSGISLLVLSHGVRCFEDLYSPTLNRRCTASWLLTSQLCHSIPMFLLSSSHRHGATEATHLSHNQTTATDHGARCTSPGRQNSGSTPFTLSPLTETPRLIRILCASRSSWAGAGWWTLLHCLVPRCACGDMNTPLWMWGMGEAHCITLSRRWMFVHCLERCVRGMAAGCTYTVSQRKCCGCSYTVWKGARACVCVCVCVAVVGVGCTYTVLQREGCGCSYTVSNGVRVCVGGWQVWVLAAHTLYHIEWAVTILTLSG